MPELTFTQARKRVKRDLRTIKRWKAQGMVTTKRDGRNYVDEEVLLKHWRTRILNNPIRVYQIRRHARQAE